MPETYFVQTIKRNNILSSDSDKFSYIFKMNMLIKGKNLRTFCAENQPAINSIYITCKTTFDFKH